MRFSWEISYALKSVDDNSYISTMSARLANFFSFYNALITVIDKIYSKVISIA